MDRNQIELDERKQMQNVQYPDLNQHLVEDAPPQLDMDIEEQREQLNHRQKMRRIFQSLDIDRDGFLNIHELKLMIRNQQCSNIPVSLANHILDIHDEDSNGQLDFEEFYQMSLQQEWLFSRLLKSYCKYLVPAPHREGEDQIAMNIDGARGYQADYGPIDGAYERSMRVCPPPLTMIAFSILEIMMFLFDIWHFSEDETNFRGVGVNTNGPAAKLFIYNPYRRFEAWRFVTYMFVHVGVMHILMNLIIQIFLGVALELVHHWWRVALVYLAGVAAGSMGTSLVNPRIYLAGASGGVYALITAHIATIIMNWQEMEFAIVQLFVFLVFCVTDCGFSAYRHLNDAHDQVGYVAHLCGAIAGLLVGIGVLRNLKVRPWERKLWWFAVTLYFLLMFSGIFIHVFDTDHFPKSRPTKSLF